MRRKDLLGPPIYICRNHLLIPLPQHMLPCFHATKENSVAICHCFSQVEFKSSRCHELHCRYPAHLIFEHSKLVLVEKSCRLWFLKPFVICCIHETYSYEKKRTPQLNREHNAEFTTRENYVCFDYTPTS